MKKILFMMMPLLLLTIAFRPVQLTQVTGTVMDTDGNPVVNCSIRIKGTNTGTSTSADGKYSILINSATDVLIFSDVDHETLEEPVKGRTVVNVVLKKQMKLLTEVVVTSAYGMKKSLRTTSADVTVVNGYHLNTVRQTNLNNALAGKVAGIQVKSQSAAKLGNAGTGQVRLRGETGFPSPEPDREGYDFIQESAFVKATDHPLSTFSIDVDAASYSNVRRMLNDGQLPPAGAVRIEEMINYFHYDYPQPTGNDPFSINTEMAVAPWNKDHKLVMIGLQGKKIDMDKLPASNLVFLIDVSGSMLSPDKLDLVKASMKMLTDQLREQDRVSIVVYAGAAGLVMPPTSGSNKTAIKAAIDQMQAGGSTAGGEGIKLAYKTAREYFVKGGNNRVILCTDGDFNVGESSDDAMVRLVEEERKSGVFLTVLGYGMGNYQDAKMQKLADKGNGNHAYIDGILEAKKVLVSEFGGTLFTIAKDVKLQIEFNPALVQAYRLIGYENRMLASEDFNDDKKDAGELGSGHTVTALYEVIPVGVKSSFIKDVDPLKYQRKKRNASAEETDELMTVKFRYKAPDGDNSRLLETVVKNTPKETELTGENFRFAAAVAEFGMLLRNSEFKSAASYQQVLKLARSSASFDKEGYRAEFIRLVETAGLLTGNSTAAGQQRNMYEE